MPQSYTPICEKSRHILIFFIYSPYLGGVCLILAPYSRYFATELMSNRLINIPDTAFIVNVIKLVFNFKTAE